MAEYHNSDTASWDAGQVRRERPAPSSQRPPQKKRRRRRRSQGGGGLLRLLGRRAGERVHVKASETLEYDMVIRSIEKGEDDGSLAISSY